MYKIFEADLISKDFASFTGVLMIFTDLYNKMKSMRNSL